MHIYKDYLSHFVFQFILHQSQLDMCLTLKKKKKKKTFDHFIREVK